MNIFIEIDYRERNAGIVEVLRTKENVVVEEKRLFIGNYLINKHISF